MKTMKTMKTMRVTVKEFAEQQGVDTGMANSVLRFLETKGLAKVVDQRKAEGQKGRAASVFEVENTVSLTFLAKEQTEQTEQTEQMEQSEQAVPQNVGG